MDEEIIEPEASAAIHMVSECENISDLKSLWQSVKNDDLINEATRKRIFTEVQYQLEVIKICSEKQAWEDGYFPN